MMGQCASREEKDQNRRNRRIEDQLKKDQSMNLKIMKLLLLGTFSRFLYTKSLVNFEALARVASRQFSSRCASCTRTALIDFTDEARQVRTLPFSANIYLSF